MSLFRSRFGPARLPADPQPIRRKRNGNWIAFVKTAARATSDATRYELRPLARIHDLAERLDPWGATRLWDAISHRLKPALENAQEVEEEERARYERDRATATAANAKVDALLVKNETDTEARLSAQDALLARERARASEALAKAAKAIGEAGHLFDRAAPDLGLQAPKARPVDYVAGRDGISVPKADLTWKPPLWAEIPVSVLLGGWIGLGIFSVSGAVHLSHLPGKNPVMALFAAFLGMLYVFFGGRAVKGTAAWAMQDVYLLGAEPGKAFRSNTALAATFVFIDGLAGATAMLLSRSASDAASHPVPLPMATVLSMAFGMAYMTFSRTVGRRIGRAAAMGPKLVFLVTEDLEERERQWRTPERLAAMAAVAECRVFEAAVAGLEDRKKAIEAEAALREARLRSLRITVPQELSDAAKDRIDKANTYATITQIFVDELDERLREAMSADCGTAVPNNGSAVRRGGWLRDLLAFWQKRRRKAFRKGRYLREERT